MAGMCLSVCAGPLTSCGHCALLWYCHVCSHGDALDAVLSRECENGRIARLLIKLGFVNERPDVRV